MCNTMGGKSVEGLKSKKSLGKGGGVGGWMGIKNDILFHSINSLKNKCDNATFNDFILKGTKYIILKIVILTI